ncbi:MAG: hypothetical protein U1F61_21920 [Opitutaceae bacterium]
MTTSEQIKLFCIGLSVVLKDRPAPSVEAEELVLLDDEAEQATVTPAPSDTRAAPSSARSS